jgi:hypothetical protein
MTKVTKTTPKKMRTNLHAIFETNKALEEDGAWVDVNGLYGLKIKVRRLRADVVQKAYERIVMESFGEGKLRKASDITTDQSVEIMKRQLAEAVLVDWVNMRDSDTGEEIPYSKELALELMEMRDFRDFVYQAANERDAFREAADRELEGN